MLEDVQGSLVLCKVPIGGQLHRPKDRNNRVGI